jgi:hypothetical protein
MYLVGEGIKDERIDAALDELRPLPESTLDTSKEINESDDRLREIVREELEASQN